VAAGARASWFLTASTSRTLMWRIWSRATLKLSTSDELLPRLRWAAALYGQTSADIAVTGGVHTAVDGLKAVMAGASAVQLASALLSHGPRYLKTLREDLARCSSATSMNRSPRRAGP